MPGDEQSVKRRCVLGASSARWRDGSKRFNQPGPAQCQACKLDPTHCHDSTRGWHWEREREREREKERERVAKRTIILCFISIDYINRIINRILRVYLKWWNRGKSNGGNMLSLQNLASHWYHGAGLWRCNVKHTRTRTYSINQTWIDCKNLNDIDKFRMALIYYMGLYEALVIAASRYTCTMFEVLSISWAND